MSCLAILHATAPLLVAPAALLSIGLVIAATHVFRVGLIPRVVRRRSASVQNLLSKNPDFKRAASSERVKLYDYL